MDPPFVHLETRRLSLKGITNKQMFEIFEHWSREEIQQLFQYSSEEAYQQDLYKHQNFHASYNRQFLAFLLTEKESGEIIGRCGIHNWNKENDRAEIGYSMEKEDRKNKGFMSEAVEAIIRYAFEELKLNRLEALVGVNNIPSLKIIERFGFVKEGLLREWYANGGTFEDVYAFAILRKEYEQVKMT